MKHCEFKLMVMVGALALGLAAGRALAQAPVITSFGWNGELVCSNLLAGSTATLEWAPSPSGPWTNSWAGLDAVAVGSEGTIRVTVPMFYRVRGSAAPPFPNPSNLVWIAAGTFTMGSPDTEPGHDFWMGEGPQTTVTLSRGFWMWKYEVTQGEFEALMHSNPSWCNGDRSSTGDPNYGVNTNRPVDRVTWYEATNYCAILTRREQAAGRLPPGWEYRLPTEAQWEYACRAGTATPFHYGNELRSGMANFNGTDEYPPCGGDPWRCYNPSGTYLGGTTSVGTYAPNAWGLYDMHGNVMEWCQDWWGDSLPGGSVTDPEGPANAPGRVIRGGSWQGAGFMCRAAFRFADHQEHRYASVGFRVALVPVQ